MAMTAGGNPGQSYSYSNMTPLIDVMLVLLIIFIITLPSQTHAIKIDNMPMPRCRMLTRLELLSPSFEARLQRVSCLSSFLVATVPAAASS